MILKFKHFASKLIHHQRRTKHRLSSNECRQIFLDYFINNHGHKFIRSSPVKPKKNDQSLLFVNAGMNQFKSIFLNTGNDDNELIENQYRNLKRAVNSQKCVRVGGKHCDLEMVGYDFIHHTFFEMLGNWSFNDYFKEDACRMAWNLLVNHYHIDPRRLFVTIFAGNEQLGLDTDLETYEIWRSIGVPKHRIIPLGMKDNFWEMGQTGPCGICTEIHYIQSDFDDQKLMDKNFLLKNSMEIWNLVFIQYFRDENENLKRLPKNFVDTGMGFERILSVVQNVNNNYQTDLFSPYFQRLKNLCKWPEYTDSLTDEKDIMYRIIADHSRMIAISIADGIEPSDRGAGYLLRRVIRRASDSLKTMIDMHKLPPNVSENDIFYISLDTTIQILGEAFPELDRESSKIFDTITNELHLYSTAIQRDTNIMKLSKSLQIEINENYEHNQHALIKCLEKIDTKISNLKQNVWENLLENQNQIESIRKDLQNIMNLFENNLSKRFGLFSSEIESKFKQTELKFIEFENESNVMMQKIIETFQLEATKRMINGDNFRIVSIENVDFLPHLDEKWKNFLLKSSLDLFGEKPLAFLLKCEKDKNSITVQLSVPSRFQSKLDAQSWFELAENKCENNRNVKISIIETNKTKRPKKMVKYLLKNDNHIDDIFVKSLQKIGETHFDQ